MPRAFVCAVIFACVASCGAVGGGRYAIRRESSGGWTLVNPDGAPVFVVALNHLAAPFYFDAIRGANGLAPCRSYDTNCQDHDLLNTKYGGNWTAATQDFVRNANSRTAKVDDHVRSSSEVLRGSQVSEDGINRDRRRGDEAKMRSPFTTHGLPNDGR